MILEPPVCLGRFQARVIEDPLQFSRQMPYGAEGVADRVAQRKKDLVVHTVHDVCSVHI